MKAQPPKLTHKVLILTRMKAQPLNLTHKRLILSRLKVQPGEQTHGLGYKTNQMKKKRISDVLELIIYPSFRNEKAKKCYLY